MEPYHVLRDSKLSVTESRLKILQLFLDNAGALAHADIEKGMKEDYDRATIYRTLQTFVERGIIHLVPTTDNTILYALCRSACAEGHHHDNHVHFVCTNCHTTTCLDDVTVPKVKLPDGFKPLDAAMIVKGVCKECETFQ